MIRDKFYLRLDNGMLLNVTGYEHPDDRVYASLKYVDHRKWTAGYQAAVRYLKREDPALIDGHGFISVPRDRIVQVLDPFERWKTLHLSPARGASCCKLHREAIELAGRLSEILGLASFGITDSLLWGNGHDDSDIDLVVQGRKNAERFLSSGPSLYDTPDFQRPSPLRLKSPYGLIVSEWPRILQRKTHMGLFRGRPFSLRVVLDQREVIGRTWTRRTWTRQAVNRKVEFEVVECADSLLFPAVYRNECGDELVDYSVVYEGVFREGDRVECQCEHLVSNDDSQSMRHRYVIRRVQQFMARRVPS